MKKRLYLIGNIFSQNHAFLDYIMRVLQKDGLLHAVEHFQEADRDFYSELQQRAQHQEHIYIVTTSKSFTLVGKLLSTLTKDTLVLKEGMLLPSKCEQYLPNSYLSRVHSTLVNVMQVQESQELPAILLSEARKDKKIHFFEHSIKEVIGFLQPLSKQFDVLLNYSQKTTGWVEITARANTFGSIDKFIQIVLQRHPAHVIESDDLVQHIINALLTSGKKITMAESCTGGLLAYLFTSHAGVSSVFEGSLVTYSNVLKENWIAVENSTLVQHGAVSIPVVQEMTEGALSIANADYALGVSGIAGPDGGSEEKPVGTIVIGMRSKDIEKTALYHFQGDRNYIQQQSAITALKMLVLGDKKVFFRK